MAKISWTNAGFWLAIGLAGGMLISDLTSPRTASASGSTSFWEEYRIATGRSYDNEIDIVWLLDWREGRLHCLSLNRAAKLQMIATLDLLEQFEITAGSKLKPHFMMVVGSFQTRQTDMCYLAEVTSGQLLCIAPPYIQGRRTAQISRPEVVDRFRFRLDADRVRPQ